MKTRFSIGTALQTPFLLLRHQPLALFAWGATRVVLTIAAFSLLLPMFAALPVGQATSPEDMERVMANFLPLQGGIWLMNFVGLLLSVVIWTAAMRATMARVGTKDRFLFLRLGLDEMVIGAIVLTVFSIAAVMLHVSLPRPDNIQSFADLAEFGRPFLIPALVLALPIALF